MAVDEGGSPGLFPALWRFRGMSVVIVLGVTVLSGAVGYLTAAPPSAVSTVALTTPSETNVLNPGVTGDASTARYIEQRADYVTGDDVLEAVAKTIPGATVTDLRKRLTVTSKAGSNILEVTATGDSAGDAVSLVNGVVTAFARASRQQMDAATRDAVAEIRDNEADLEAGGSPSAARAASISALQQRISELNTDNKVFGDGVDFVQQARAESATEPGPPLREIALGFVVGLVIAAVLAWVRADRDRRVFVPERPETVLGAPLLASVPRDSGRRRTPIADDAHPIPTSLDRLPKPQYALAAAALLRRGNQSRIVAVISSTDSRDRSEAVLNMAMAVAGDGGRVLIVDADPDGRLCHRLGDSLMRTGVNMANVAFGRIDSVTSMTIREDVTVSLVVPGPHQKRESLPALREFIEKLVASEDQYDIVLIDTPALETSALIPALIRASAGVVAVVPYGSEESAVVEMRRTAEIFTRPILGYVFTEAH